MTKIIPLLFLIFLFSCKKESPIEPTILTIEPGAYYPVYPGSYWKYVNLYNNDTFQIDVYPEYKKHHYKSDFNCFMTEYVLVPFIGSTPYYGYSIPKITYWDAGDSTDCRTLIPFLKEEVGGLYSEYHAYSNHDSKSIFVSGFKDTMTVQGILYYDIIVVIFQDKYNQTIMQQTNSYYARDVGKIRSISTINLYNPAIVGTGSDLLEFSINH